MEKYREYDKKTLLKLQKVECEMLKDFISVCEKHDIEYFAFSGTTLGAVRHQGFIPWDDDIDLGMLRKDYEKFVQYATKEIGDKYYFLDYRTNKEYFCPSCKMCKKNTAFVGYDCKNVKTDLGIFLDLFQFDYVSNDEKKRKKQIKKAWLLGKLAILCKVDNPVIFVDGIKAKLLLFGCKIGHFILNLFGLNHQKLLLKGDKCFNNVKTNYICFPYETEPFMSLFDIDDIYPTKTMKFEDINVKVPNKVENVLLHTYGSTYMELPPEKDRHNHCPYKLSFDTTKDE